MYPWLIRRMIIFTSNKHLRKKINKNNNDKSNSLPCWQHINMLLDFQPPATGDPWGKKTTSTAEAPSIHPCSFKFLPRIRGWMKIGSLKLHWPLKGAFIVSVCFLLEKKTHRLFEKQNRWSWIQINVNVHVNRVQRKWWKLVVIHVLVFFSRSKHKILSSTKDCMTHPFFALDGFEGCFFSQQKH